MSISAAVYTGIELSKQGANHPSAIVTSRYILSPRRFSLAIGNPRRKLQMEIT